MLERLLRESLTPDFLERRHHALLMLRISPYRGVLSRTAEKLVFDPRPVVHQPAAYLLTYLVRTGQREAVLRRLQDAPAPLQSTLLTVLAHGGGVPASTSVLPFLDRPETRRMATYAAGMSGHPDLRVISAGADFDPVVRQRADWWLAAGPAIHT